MNRSFHHVLRYAPLWLVALSLGALLAACSDDGVDKPGEAAVDVSAQADTSAADEDALAAEDAEDVAPDDAEDVEAPPAVLSLTAVDPSQGKASGGETVVVAGTGFVDGAEVLFDGTPVDADGVFVVDDKQIQVRTPPHPPGLANIRVNLPGDPPPTALLENAFLYFNEVVIIGIDPPHGPVGGGTPITIHGTGFLGTKTVLVGGKAAIGVEVIDDDELIAVTPPGSFGSAPVHVVNERGIGLMKKGFFYHAPPHIESLSPAAGPTFGGQQVQLVGSGLTADAKVSFGQAQASILVVSGHNKLGLATPPGEEGPVDVHVETPWGKTTLPGGYFYVGAKLPDATTILSIAPPLGPVAGGQTVTLIATGLVSKDDTTVFFAGKLATIVNVAAANHTLLVKTPSAEAVGPVDVMLMTSKGTATAAGGYTYEQGLVLTSITPSAGPPAGNTKVRIKGSGFAKGKPSVKIGAFKTSPVVVLDDSELETVTPPGSPGYVNVSVSIGDEIAVLKNGFSYVSEQLELYVTYPDSGSQAGGTFVHVFGSGFKQKMKLTFGGKAATHVTFIDPTHMTCKTPPGKVGAVDVVADVGSSSRTLVGGFTYFNPMSKYGGTWGPAVDGSVNVTVLDGQTGEPVPDAFVMLWTDPATPHQGYSDANGQITFSGEDVLGEQMVSASKEKYESASVVVFDATNVTIYIQPIPDPSPGSPPPGQPPPTVSGKVIGLDKYVMIPLGNCYQSQGKPGVPAPACKSCGNDSQCASDTSDYSCVDFDADTTTAKFCARDCSLGQECPGGFTCSPQKAGGARCAPQAGELTSICYRTKPHFLAGEYKPPIGPDFEANPANGYSYKMYTGYGEMAIVCFGGYKAIGAILDSADAASINAFTPTMMGVKRHVNVMPGDSPTDVHIKLDIPLTRTATIRLDDPPKWPIAAGAYLLTAAIGYLDLGSDGVIQMLDVPQKFLAPFTQDHPELLEMEWLPTAFVGEIADASLTVLGLEVELLGQSQLPMSAAVLHDIHNLSDDAMLRRLDGGPFETIATGVQHNVNAIWGADIEHLWAVGDQGTVLAWGGNGWTVQAKLAETDLNAVAGTDSTHVWAVGDKGSVLTFTGMGWQPLKSFSGAPLYNSVFATQTDSGLIKVWAAGSSGVYKLTEQGGEVGLIKDNPSPYLYAWGIHGSDADHVWAVGNTGAVVFWNGQVWQSQISGSSIALRSVWAASPTDAWAVGEAGQILHWDGAKWAPEPSPVSVTLKVVRGTSATDVWAAGDKGTLLHWDGATWEVIALKAVDKALAALWVSANDDLFAMGDQELLVGPMLYPPLDDTPKKDGTLPGMTLKWGTDPETVEPHFNWVSIGIPGMGGVTPVWNIIAEGSLGEVTLPDFPNIQGTPGIPKQTPLQLTMIRGYKEGFDIDAYDLTDLNQLSWGAWAINALIFFRQ